MLKGKYTDFVFLNCPFDREYLKLRNATIFTIIDCGFTPRCTLEGTNAETRIEIILKIIEESKYGIHDISRTELDNINQLPRFNMPLELGLFIGAKRYGQGQHKKKDFLILDHTKHRYQKFMSDISGYDIKSHDNKEKRIIIAIRDWLRSISRRITIPGGDSIYRRFCLFKKELPDICKKLSITVNEVTYFDYVEIVSQWIDTNKNILLIM